MAGNDFLKQNRAVLWVQEDGPGTEWKPLGLSKTSVTGRSKPGRGVSAVYGADRFGNPVVLFTTDEAPGGLPGMTIGHYDEGEVSFLEKRQAEGCPIYVQIRYTSCGSLDNPRLWDAIDHNGLGIVGDISPGDGPVTPYAGGAIESSGNVQFQYGFRLVRTALSRAAVTETNALTDIAMVTESLCNDCGNGYPGADKIVIVGTEAGSGVTANLLISTNGGASFAASSADPFAADEHIGFVDYEWIDTDKLRLYVGCSVTDAAALAKIAYTDITLGAETTTVWTPVVSTSSDGTVGEIVTGMAALYSGRLYVATDGGLVYVVSNNGESWASDAVSSPGVDIVGFAKNPDGGHVWAYGASNTIMREVGQSGSFIARTGPSGGGNFGAVAVANDGTLYAGNGTSLYKSDNEAGNTGGWTVLKDFGASHAVKEIFCVGGEASRGGDSQILRVVVDDSTPGNGEVWESVDGGASWRQITAVTNGGYNAAVHSGIDNNFMVVVGDATGGTGTVHLLQAV